MHSISQVNNREFMWEWAKEVMLKTIFPLEEDGAINPWQKGYMSDNNTFVIGQPRLRMLRIRKCMYIL